MYFSNLEELLHEAENGILSRTEKKTLAAGKKTLSLLQPVREQARFTLQKKFGQKYDSFRFSDAANAVDELLKEVPDISREQAFRKRMEQKTERRKNRLTDRVKRHKEPER